MSEVAKLRQRLKNINRNVTEYRMTVAEAQDLLTEIDNLSKLPVQEKPPEVAVEHTVTIRTMDGGTF